MPRGNGKKKEREAFLVGRGHPKEQGCRWVYATRLQVGEKVHGKTPRQRWENREEDRNDTKGRACIFGVYGNTTFQQTKAEGGAGQAGPQRPSLGECPTHGHRIFFLKNSAQLPHNFRIIRHNVKNILAALVTPPAT